MAPMAKLSTAALCGASLVVVLLAVSALHGCVASNPDAIVARRAMIQHTARVFGALNKVAPRKAREEQGAVLHEAHSTALGIKQKQ